MGEIRQGEVGRVDETRRGEAKRLDKTKRGRIGWGKTRECCASAIKFHAELWHDGEISRRISTAFYVAAKSCIEFRRNFTKN